MPETLKESRYSCDVYLGDGGFDLGLSIALRHHELRLPLQEHSVLRRAQLNAEDVVTRHHSFLPCGSSAGVLSWLWVFLLGGGAPPLHDTLLLLFCLSLF